MEEQTETEIKEVDYVVGVEEEFNPIPVLAFLCAATLVALALVALLCWLAVNFHEDDAGVKEWKIWSDRCEQITNLNHERLRSDKEVTYFDGCPEGPRNEPVTINR